MDNQFKGRKGQKRLKELNDSIEYQIRQTDAHAAETSEMELILRSIPDPNDRLYYVQKYRVLDHFWGSIKTVGFLRLAAAWIHREKATELNRQKIDEMFAAILPSEELQKLRTPEVGEQVKK